MKPKTIKTARRQKRLLLRLIRTLLENSPGRTTSESNPNPAANTVGRAYTAAFCVLAVDTVTVKLAVPAVANVALEGAMVQVAY